MPLELPFKLLEEMKKLKDLAAAVQTLRSIRLPEAEKAKKSKAFSSCYALLVPFRGCEEGEDGVLEPLRAYLSLFEP